MVLVKLRYFVSPKSTAVEEIQRQRHNHPGADGTNLSIFKVAARHSETAIPVNIWGVLIVLQSSL